MRMPSISPKPIPRAPAASRKSWRVENALRFNNIHTNRLQYFFAFPLAMIFANVQEVLFVSNYSLFGLTAVTLSSGAFCLGAGGIFIFANKENISFISKLSAAITLLGCLPWLILPDSVALLVAVMVLMAGAGGCATSGAFSYAFVLNNTERFWGTALIAIFYPLIRIHLGIPFIPPAILKAFLSVIIIATIVCLSLYKSRDFAHLQDQGKKKFTASIWLTLFLFLAPSFINMFYVYIPGVTAPSVIMLTQTFSVLAIFIAILIHMFLPRSVWIQCSLFFICAVGTYALLYTPEASLWHAVAHALRGFEIIGYMIGFYLVGCICNKFANFNMFKRVVIVFMPVSVLMYLIPDLLAKTPEFLHSVAMISSAAMLVVFLLLAPAFSKHVFSADWSEDFRHINMSAPKAQTEYASRLDVDDLDLTPREKEIAQLLLKGCSNKQIADNLGIKFDTAKFHIKNLYKKLHINSRAELFFTFSAGSETPPSKQP